MNRVWILVLLLATALFANLALPAGAQEADKTGEPRPAAPAAVHVSEPPPMYTEGPPLMGTVGNPWTYVMQQWLNTYGFWAGPVDGWFGKGTRYAVTKFQEKAVELGLLTEVNGAWTWETSQAQQAWPLPPPPPPKPPSTPSSVQYGVWDRLAQCESNGNWSINTGNGFFGGLQFTLGSWRAAGGSGYPHQNSREEQIRVAENLLDMQGWGAWPTCSRRIGVR